MGVDFRSKALIGLRINPLDGAKFGKEKAFEHDFPEDWVVDPIEGKKLWRTVHKLVPELQADDLVVGVEREEGQIIQIFVSILEVETGSHRINGDPTCASIPSGVLLDEAKQNLKKRLEPHGLWNEAEFGLWAISHVSY